MKLSESDRIILHWVFSGKPIKRAILFGLVARDEANSQSDIDILVELDYSEPIGMKYFGFQTVLTELLNKKVDLVSDNSISSYIKPFIVKAKTLIYERKNNGLDYEHQTF